MRRVAALSVWGFLVWVVLTWTRTAEQLAFGAAFALVVGVCLAPLGDVPGPWALLRPRRLWAVLRIAVAALRRIVIANLKLSARIWSPRRPLSSGMVIVPTTMRTDGGLTAVALLTSLIVDNQIVDLDRAHHQLQYHAVAVPPEDPEEARAAINGPIEDLLAPLEEHK